MKSLPYFLLDVFTGKPFGGNPLAVFPNVDDVPTEIMQRIANELNLSETTFIQKARNESSDCTVRIFTPKSEIPMAGHPTIGTAHCILSNGLFDPINPLHLVFDEGVGPVNVDFEFDGALPSNLLMHQPLPEFSEALDRTMIAKVISLDESDLVEDLPVQIVSCGMPFILIPLGSLDAAQRAKVRMDLLESELAHLDSQEILIFTQETEHPQSEVHCRMFAPRLGVPEDPATGSAHGPLGCYLFRHQVSRFPDIVNEQGYEMGRPSRIIVKIESTEGEITDVAVGGDCVAMGQGSLQIEL